MSISLRSLATLVLALAGGGVAAAPVLQHYQHEQVLGTSLRMSVAGVGPAEAEAAHAAALAEIGRLEAVFSTWREDSELSRLNRAGAPLPVSPELRRLLALCEHWREASDGAFSCRLGGPLQAWREAAAIGVLPDRVQLRRQARALAQLQMEPASALPAPSPGLLQWQVDGVAKGHILDLALQRARDAAPQASGIALDIGGDAVYWGGPEAGQGWRVGVADPLAPADNAAPRATLQLRSLAIASSGHRSRGFKVGRRQYSHLLDPMEGWPLAYPPSATVVAPDAATADALATALSVMPIRDGLAWVEQLPGVEALVVSDRGVSFASSGWHRLLSVETGGAVAAWPRPLRIDYEIPPQDTARYRAPYLALWIARPDGSPVRQLLVLGDRSRYLQELPQWWRLYGRDDEPAVHGIARPTRLPGHYSVTWDGLDDQGRPCPPGEYRIQLEAAREHGGRQRLSLAVHAPDGQARHLPRAGDEIGALHAHRGDDAP